MKSNRRAAMMHFHGCGAKAPHKEEGEGRHVRPKPANCFLSKPGSAWSVPNRKRIDRMIQAGLMTPAGLAPIEAAKVSGDWERSSTRPDVQLDVVPQELADALAGNAKAAEFFQGLAPSYRKIYILWIATAKKPETRQRRTAEAIQKLERGEKLGLK
ncbi:MAG: hypothetical protein EOM52_12580 [Clostridia bacterium]|nr:hypothetical protein [Clostridia bacterium]